MVVFLPLSNVDQVRMGVLYTLRYEVVELVLLLSGSRELVAPRIPEDMST